MAMDAKQSKLLIFDIIFTSDFCLKPLISLGNGYGKPRGKKFLAFFDLFIHRRTKILKLDCLSQIHKKTSL